jgi:hypothetical protein
MSTGMFVLAVFTGVLAVLMVADCLRDMRGE